MNVLVCQKEADSLALMERVLRNGAPLAAEYPLVFEERFPGRVLSLEEEDAVRSTCSILPREFVCRGARLPVGLVGSVATDPDWQGKGLATRLMIEAEAALHVAGCHVALLWAADPVFYMRRGYSPVGVEHDFVVPRSLAERLPAPVGVRKLSAQDAAAIHSLYERHPARVERTLDETKALLGCPGMVTRVLERDGQVVGYACRNRGADLTDAIHEWGGDVEDVLALVRAHLEGRFGSDDTDSCLVMMSPATATDLAVRFGQLGVERHVGILGLARIVNAEGFARFLDDCLGPLGRCELLETENGPCFSIEGPKDQGLLDEGGAIALVMPSAEVRPSVEGFIERFGFEDSNLPFEPFAWGLDSI